jgi:hypothetical protein
MLEFACISHESAALERHEALRQFAVGFRNTKALVKAGSVQSPLSRKEVSLALAVHCSR